MIKKFLDRLLGTNKNDLEVAKIKQETRVEVQQLQEKIDKMNVIMKKTVSYNIYKATGGVK